MPLQIFFYIYCTIEYHVLGHDYYSHSIVAGGFEEMS